MRHEQPSPVGHDPVGPGRPLVAQAPVQDRFGNWWLSRMSDVSAMLKHPTTQIDTRKNLEQIQRISEALGRSYPALDILQNLVILTNGDRHAALRREAETIVRTMPEAVPQSAFTSLVDGLTSRTAGTWTELDVIAEIIDPCMHAWRKGVFGLDHDAAADICRASDELMRVYSQGLVRGSPEHLNAAAATAATAFRDGMGLGDRAFSTADYVRFAVASVAMGTLQGLCANILSILAEDEALQDSLRGNPGLLPGFTIEAERFCNSFRFLLRDTGAMALRAGDLHLPAHTSVILDLGAANRDPAIWDDPDRFDMARPRRPNLAFSAGTHACLGVQSTRLFVPKFLQALLGKLRLRPGSTPPVWTENWILHNPVRLPMIIAPV